jgi:hypothetical protein
MSPELDRLLAGLSPPTPNTLALRLRFGLRCCERVEHLLEDPAVLQALCNFRDVLSTSWRSSQDTPSATSLQPHEAIAVRLAALARSHPGSRSLDGVGHAAVSATLACAAAVAGRPRQAAEYTAYAMVYGQGGHGATTDAEAFAPEEAWLAAQLAALLPAEVAAEVAPCPR